MRRRYEIEYFVARQLAGKVGEQHRARLQVFAEFHGEDGLFEIADELLDALQFQLACLRRHRCVGGGVDKRKIVLVAGENELREEYFSADVVEEGREPFQLIYCLFGNCGHSLDYFLGIFSVYVGRDPPMNILNKKCHWADAAARRRRH